MVDAVLEVLHRERGDFYVARCNRCDAEWSAYASEHEALARLTQHVAISTSHAARTGGNR